ncbi:MAG: hypothetical protein IPN36_16800 [Bacteroidetes bacterium]|nr:hypothetical protein [Bacteroidota bacterium]
MPFTHIRNSQLIRKRLIQYLKIGVNPYDQTSSGAVGDKPNHIREISELLDQFSGLQLIDKVRCLPASDDLLE